jgi:hypothetical protein
MPGEKCLSHFAVQTRVYPLKGAETDMCQVRCHSYSFYSRENGKHAGGCRSGEPSATVAGRQKVSPFVSLFDWTAPKD